MIDPISPKGNSSNISDIYQFLYNDLTNQNIFNKSKQNLEKLIKIYKKEHVSTFIGAGASKPLGIKDWDDLTTMMYEKAKENGYKLKIKPKSKEKYPEFIQSLFDYLEINNIRHLYYEVLKSELHPKSTLTSGLFNKIIKLSNIHITTNFDNAIEEAIEDFETKSESLCIPDLPIVSFKKNFHYIYHLHGKSSQERYIFKENDYKFYYSSLKHPSLEPKNRCIISMLKHFYKYSNMIFIGFSFEDPYLKRLIESIAEETLIEEDESYKQYESDKLPYKSKDINHFLFIPGDENAVDKFIFEKIKIYPIIYNSSQHSFIELLIKKLIKNT